MPSPEPQPVGHTNRIVTPSPTVQSTVTGDGIVLLDMASGNIFSSNAIGARIWLRLHEGIGSADIALQISADCGASLRQVENDVDDFIRALTQRGLVTCP